MLLSVKIDKKLKLELLDEINFVISMTLVETNKKFFHLTCHFDEDDDRFVEIELSKKIIDSDETYSCLDERSYLKVKYVFSCKLCD